MRNLKKKITILILFLNLSLYIFIPFSGKLYIPDNKNNKNLSDNISGFIQNVNIQENSKDILIPKNNDKDSIYGVYLREELTKLKCSNYDSTARIKIIIMFPENISKEQRISIIDSLFNDYEIINNYNIIPGVYLKVNPYELINKESVIANSNIISGIYKSIKFKSPYIINDIPNTSSLSDADFPNWWRSDIGASGLSYDGTGVRVAVIDTGIYEHPDLNIVASKNFVSDEVTTEDINGHGTHVAGIIGSSGSTSGGKYVGIAPGVSLINARAGDTGGSLESGDIISAIDWCADQTAGGQADIISMSFGGGYPDDYTPYTIAISNAVKDGVICVVAAGNSGSEYFMGGSPAAEVDSIVVGASDKDDKLASFSSWGPAYDYIGYPDVVAPGVNIISTSAKGSLIQKEMEFLGDYFDYSGDGDYIPLSGTSMATPVVSGALAILLQAYPSLNPETARIALLEGARPLKDNNNRFVRAGAGIINISASLNFLANLSTMNDVAKFYPDILPTEPYNLLNFPGDHQKFSIFVISGVTKSFTIQIPNVDGISISVDSNPLIFSEPDTKTITFDVRINSNATAGLRKFTVNLTSTLGGVLYDTLNFTIDMKYPEHRVLFDSFHGLNDQFPEVSFYQMGYYEAIKDLAEMNISADYLGEYWSPDYDEDTDNSLLTEERLTQYDLVVLQNPILPYTLKEMQNLKNYFENGGNILFLGTRYQDLCVDNINKLFSVMSVNVQVDKNTIVDDEFVGAGAIVTSQSVTNFASHEIFNGVSKFYWKYGVSFSISGGATSIANLDGKTVVAVYDGTSSNKGKFTVFGDTHWLYYDYSRSGYSADHQQLFSNLMNYYFKDEISVNIKLNSCHSSNPTINLTITVKNTTSNNMISSATLNTKTIVTIKNDSFSEQIKVYSGKDGIAINKSYNIPYPSVTPYIIEVNFTDPSLKAYNKTTKVLYYDSAAMPKITSFSISEANVTRASGDFLYLNATLDSNSYSVKAYGSIYSFSFHNSKATINKTLDMTAYSGNKYSATFDPAYSDPSGPCFFYIIPENPTENYYNPSSPRLSFEILNDDPTIDEKDSSFSVSGSDETISFDDTKTSSSYKVYGIPQNSTLNFEVKANDKVSYEDSPSELKVYINLYIYLITSNGYIVQIPLYSYDYVKLDYDSDSTKFKGSYTIPFNLEYYTIEGAKSISTITDYQNNGDYIGVLTVTVWDSEGGNSEFIILVDITAAESISDNYWDLIFWILFFLALTILGVVVALVIAKRRKKKRALIEIGEEPL